MRHWWILLIVMFAAAACQPTPTPVLPTLAQFAEATTSSAPDMPTDTVTSVPSAETAASSATTTPTPLPNATLTRTPTVIPQQPRATLPPSVTPTPNIAASTTARIEQAPRFSTLTPNPIVPTTTPQVAADVVITEAQFQQALNIRLADMPSIQSAIVDFTTESIVIGLTASGGDALISSNVVISVQVANGVAFITISDIQLNAPEPPPLYLQVITTDLYPAVIDTMDGILRERLGGITNLENIVLTGSAMNITLLVPASIATP
ncbi:MAG: hypothetical protein HXY40_15205 [Chloroflexi bacterium]|nr:hypothetical protein [Chloroflexota bacterium]